MTSTLKKRKTTARSQFPQYPLIPAQTVVTPVALLVLLYAAGPSSGADDRSGTVSSGNTCAQDQQPQKDFAPEQSSLPVPPPDDAIMLFDGQDANVFLSMDGTEMDWITENGVLVSTGNQRRSNHLVSKLHFRDAEIHVEFMLPGDSSGNSGIYIHGNYELQIINSSGKKELDMGCMGAIYGYSKPRINACRPPGVWQVYDIRYRAPRRSEGGEITEKGSITAWLNGKKVQEDVPLGEPKSKYHPYRYGTTPYLQEIWQRQKKTMTGPLFLQDHDSPVRFRNIWIRTLDERAILYQPSKTE